MYFQKKLKHEHNGFESQEAGEGSNKDKVNEVTSKEICSNNDTCKESQTGDTFNKHKEDRIKDTLKMEEDKNEIFGHANNNNNISIVQDCKEKNENESGCENHLSDNNNNANDSGQENNVTKSDESNKNIDLEKCDICGQFLNNSDIIYYQGHPQNAVEEFIALTNEKLVLSSGKLHDNNLVLFSI